MGNILSSMYIYVFGEESGRSSGIT